MSLPTDNWKKECGAYVNSGIQSDLKKDGNCVICDYMDEIWGHYAKWKCQS